MMNTMPDRFTCAYYDITDPTPYEEWEEETEDEEEPHEILKQNYEPYICPFCGKPIMSDVYAVCATLPGDTEHKYMRIIHTDCLTDERQETLEAVGYELVEEKAEEFED